MNEKQYAEMTRKLKQEMTELELEMERLGKRHEQIMELLFPDTDDVVLEPHQTSELLPADQATQLKKQVEDAMLRHLNKHPGSALSFILEVHPQYSRYDISHALTRLRNRKQAITKGKGRTAVWHLFDESLV